MRGAAFALLFAAAGCSYVTLEQGQKMQDDIAKLQRESSTLDKRAADLKRATEEAEGELKKLRNLVDEATKVVTRNSADLGTVVEKMKVDLAAAQGRLEDLQTSINALQKSFTEYRAASDAKLEKAVAATTVQNAPPIPEKADDIFNDGKKRLGEKNYVEARRMFDAFLARFPTDPRAAQVQFLVGESYLQENRYANAIGAYTKLIDNYPKSEMVPDAMYRNGTAFYALKYCGDARIYFQELIKRFPKTEWRNDANEQLKKLQKDVKNKAVCQS